MRGSMAQPPEGSSLDATFDQAATTDGCQFPLSNACHDLLKLVGGNV